MENLVLNNEKLMGKCGYLYAINFLTKKFNLEKFNMGTYIEIPIEEFNKSENKSNAIALYSYIKNGCENNKVLYELLDGEKWELKKYPYNTNYDDVECMVIQDPTQW